MAICGRYHASNAVHFTGHDRHLKRCLLVADCCIAKGKDKHLQRGASSCWRLSVAVVANLSTNFKISKLSKIAYSDLRKWRCASDHTIDNAPAKEVQEAHEAVVELLEESGISKEDAVFISRKAVNYIHELMDAVHELDELDLWGSWQIECGAIGEEHTTFKNKVLNIARRKRDMGLIPYLESIGVNPLSTRHISRYLFTEPLPCLIEKINFLNKLFSPANSHRRPISSMVRRMMMRLSVSADDDLQQSLSFFEKMEARRGGLAILDSGDDLLACLIESFPKILLRNVNEHLISLVGFFEDIGISKGYIESILLCYPPVILLDIEADIKPRMRNLKKVGIRTNEIGKMLMKYPWLLSKCIQDNIDDVIASFAVAKVPKKNVVKGIKKCPQLLGCLPERLQLMVNQLNGFCIKSNTLTRVVSSSPHLLLRRPREFSEVVSFLEELGLDTENMARILNRCPEIYAYNVEHTLRRKVKFLIEHGICGQRLQRVVQKYPEILVKDMDQTVKPLILYLEHVGLSKENVAFMVSGFPPLLGYSVEGVLKPKLEYLVNTMGRSVKEVVIYPRYFSYSLEKKINPRFKILRNRRIQCDLKTMLSKSDDEFAEEFLDLSRMLVPLIDDLQIK